VSANLDLVRSIYADWERGDYSSAYWADTGIEYTVDDFGPLVTQTWTGLTGMAEGARSIVDVFELARIVADEYRELDAERVLTLDRRSGTLKQSRIEFGTSTALPAMGAHLFHITNGRVTRLVMYSHRDRALAELGLRRRAQNREDLRSAAVARLRLPDHLAGGFPRSKRRAVRAVRAWGILDDDQRRDDRPVAVG
jgi:hypothetical protein